MADTTSGKEYLQLQDRYYQVAWTVRDEKTMERELAPLDSIADHNLKYLLTMDNDPPASHNGIRRKYVLDWLLDK